MLLRPRQHFRLSAITNTCIALPARTDSCSLDLSAMSQALDAHCFFPSSRAVPSALPLTPTPAPALLTDNRGTQDPLPRPGERATRQIVSAQVGRFSATSPDRLADPSLPAWCPRPPGGGGDDDNNTKTGVRLSLVLGGVKTTPRSVCRLAILPDVSPSPLRLHQHHMLLAVCCTKRDLHQDSPAPVCHRQPCRIRRYWGALLSLVADKQQQATTHLSPSNHPCLVQHGTATLHDGGGASFIPHRPVRVKRWCVGVGERLYPPGQPDRRRTLPPPLLVASLPCPTCLGRGK